MGDSGLKAASGADEHKDILCGRGVITGVQEFSRAKRWGYIVGLQDQHKF